MEDNKVQVFSVEDFLRYQARMGMGLDLIKIRDRSTADMQLSRRYIMGWLKMPITNERNLREASRKAYRTNQQYKELIQYKSSQPMWRYILKPFSANYTQASKRNMRRDFYNYSAYIEKMNLPHELERILRITFIDGVCYGVCVEEQDSFTIYPLNPDICRIAMLEDGTFLYEVDMERIPKDALVAYPKVIRDLWEKYNSDKTFFDRWQLVPGDVSFCMKADEALLHYSLPPYVSTLPLVSDLDNYTELAAAEAELSMYKMVAMTIPLDEHKKPTMNFTEATKYYDQVAANLPDEVGAIATPFSYTIIGFDESSTTTKVDRISDATNRFWAGSCVNSLIFGDATNKSATALKLSVMKDEQMIYTMIKQAGRIINRILKYKFPPRGTKVRFSLEFLPVTWMNLEDRAKQYRDGGMYGMPTKMAYAATLGISPENFEGMNMLEEGVFEMFDTLKPLHASTTMSAAESDGAGRPSTDETGELPAEQTDRNRETGGD